MLAKGLNAQRDGIVENFPWTHLETLGGLAMSLIFIKPIMSKTEEMSFFIFLNSNCLS